MKYRPSPPLRLLRRFIRSVENNGIRGAMVHSYQRLFRSLKNHGFSGTFERAFIKAPMPPPRALALPTHPFDLLHGTDTGGNVSSADYAAVSLSALYATGYLGVPPSTLRPVLAELLIRFEDFTFVDIGCGKGRALLIASELPFRRLVGLEIAMELCEVARANVALNPAWKERISIVNGDAIPYEFPEGPLVLFFYYPFHMSALRRLVTNLAGQLRNAPRSTYLLHADFYANAADINAIPADNPRYRQVLNSFPFIREVSDKAYPISPEDVAAEPSGATAIRFTLFSVDLNALNG
jgi:SAM-dependent methyltransferase